MDDKNPRLPEDIHEEVPAILPQKFPSNGSDFPPGEAKVNQAEFEVERVSESDLTFLRSMNVEVVAMGKRLEALRRETTLLSADIIRKRDDLTTKSTQIKKKYDLERGRRELDIKTGIIVEAKESK